MVLETSLILYYLTSLGVENKCCVPHSQVKISDILGLDIHLVKSVFGLGVFVVELL